MVCLTLHGFDLHNKGKMIWEGIFGTKDKQMQEFWCKLYLREQLG